MGIWSAAEIVDNSANNGVQADLEFADNKAFAAFQLTTDNTTRIYERDGAWSVRNTVGFAPNTGKYLDAVAPEILGHEQRLVRHRAVYTNPRFRQ